jgi:hypothetical protein
MGGGSRCVVNTVGTRKPALWRTLAPRRLSDYGMTWGHPEHCGIGKEAQSRLWIWRWDLERSHGDIGSTMWHDKYMAVCRNAGHAGQTEAGKQAVAVLAVLSIVLLAVVAMHDRI